MDWGGLDDEGPEQLQGGPGIDGVRWGQQFLRGAELLQLPLRLDDEVLGGVVGLEEVADPAVGRRDARWNRHPPALPVGFVVRSQGVAGHWRQAIFSLEKIRWREGDRKYPPRRTARRRLLPFAARRLAFQGHGCLICPQ